MTAAGRVRCWGLDTQGQASPPWSLPLPTAQLALGSLHRGGAVQCWGYDNAGQASAPSDLGDCADLAAGNWHSCALTVEGLVRCWGSNSAGQSTAPTGLQACSAAVGRGHIPQLRAGCSRGLLGLRYFRRELTSGHG